MTDWTSRFGTSPVNPVSPQYEALTISANTQLVWPVETVAGTPYVAAQIDVTATAGGLSLLMPDATLSSPGNVCSVTNVGSLSFTLTDTNGNPIIVIAAGQTYVITLTSNLVSSGTWRTTLLGSTTSNANAATLAGAGLIASGSQLELNFPAVTLGVNQTITSGFRANQIIWDGAVGNLQLDTVANLTAGWWVLITNEGSGALTISTSGADTINGVASIVLPQGSNGQFYSTLVGCSASGFNTFGNTPAPIPITGGGTGAITAGAALSNLGGSSIGISIFTAPSAAAVIALLGINTTAFTELTVTTNQTINSSSGGLAYVATTSGLNFSLPLTTSAGISTAFFFTAYAQGGPLTLTPNVADSINGTLAGTAITIPQGAWVIMLTDAAGHWWALISAGGGGIPWAIAAGTGDAVTAIYTPANTALTDGLLLSWRALGPNTLTNPTFAPDGLTAHVITKNGGQALAPGDVSAALSEMITRYNLANSRWELLNPTTRTSLPQTSLASASTTDLGSVASTNILVTGTTGISSLGSSASINNPLYTVQFQGALTLTYNAVSLILPGAQNISVSAGDRAVFEYLGSGNWTCLFYQRVNGQTISMAGATTSIASATTTDLGTTLSNSVAISGTTTITSFGSSASLANPIYFLRFTGALILTYNGSSLILPGAANITTSAGDTATAEYLGSGNWRVTGYVSASATPGASGVLQSGSFANVSEASIDFSAATLAANVILIEVYALTAATDNTTLVGLFRLGGVDIGSGYSWSLSQTVASGSGPTRQNNNSDSSFQIMAAMAGGGTTEYGLVTLRMYRGAPTFAGVSKAKYQAVNYNTGLGAGINVDGSVVCAASDNASGISFKMSSGNISFLYQITGH
jgi:hypothetical protein